VDTGAVTTVVDQMTLDDVLPGGAIVARTAPATPGQAATVEQVVGTDRSRVQLGPAYPEYVGAL
jgi:hypothetical protein